MRRHKLPQGTSDEIIARLAAQINARTAATPALYTLGDGSNYKIGAPERRPTSDHSKNRREKIGQRKERIQRIRGMSTRERAKWAERNYVAFHIAGRAELKFRGLADLDMLLGLDGYQGECWKHACHAATRRKLAIKLARRIARAARRDRRAIYFITLIHDGWQTPINQPTLKLRDIRQRTRDCLKFLGFDGVAFIELDTITCPLEATEGHILAPHVHAVGYVEPSQAERLAAKLGASSRLSCEAGAPTVDLKPLESLADVRRAVAYALKPPLSTKRFVPRKDGNGSRLATNRTRQVYVYARMAEVLSYVGFRDLILSRGSMGRLVTEAIGQASTSKQPREQWLTHAELNRVWQRYWNARGRPEFEAVRIG